MRLTATFKKVPRYFWIACCVPLAIVGASLVYTLTYTPERTARFDGRRSHC